ncbi:CotH kinase family protein [Methanoculleus sp.]|uniref:CotH kinase family protein n=1 Tax=Methanoculleus sp. TaxID=90427 RepID=UPI0026306146|nr:CotH kinase family protein [Methanoculleus sp.]MDI6866293.1 CotH kinase family protein [Methanoculleus sp.]
MAGAPSLALVIAVLTICSGCSAAMDTGGDSTSLQDQADLQADPSHSSSAEPDYAVVFPTDRVNTMTITISPENWQKMLDNMTELYGEFGGSTASGMPAGQAFQGGIQPDGARGMGNTADIDPVYVPANISFEDQVWTDVGIRFKGQMSLGSTWREGSYKISFKLNFDKFEDENPAIKNQRFYGFDELNLQSGYGDNSLMRDMIVPTIFRESGVPAPHTAFYRIYVDYGEGPVYFGLYTMVESVEDTVIKTQFEDDSGNLYKPEGTGATFAQGTLDTESFEKKTNKGDENWSDVEALYTILNSDLRKTNPAAWRAQLESVLYVDEFLRWLATNTVIQNWDTYGSNCRNFYLYTDPTDGRIVWIPWDNNFALNGNMGGGLQGNFAANDNIGRMNGFPENTTRQLDRQRPADVLMAGNLTGRGIEQGAGGGGMGRTLSLDLGSVGDNWPLIRYLADDPVYFEKYRDYLEMVVTTSFEPTKMEETYRYYHALISPYVIGAEGEQPGYTNLDSPEAFEASLETLIEHAYARHDAVMDYLATGEAA